MKVGRLKDYLGLLVVIAIWICFITSMIIHPPNLSEPVSQYGYYSDTRWLFALSFIGFGVLYYLFTRQLDRYWRYASLSSLLGSMFFALTGLIPYQPYAHRFVFDAHNMSITLAAIFYSLPMLFISYSSAHQKIAQISRYTFIIMLALVVLSFVARIYDLGIFYFQIIAVLPFHAWIISTNTLLLERTDPPSKSQTRPLL